MTNPVPPFTPLHYAQLVADEPRMGRDRNLVQTVVGSVALPCRLTALVS